MQNNAGMRLPYLHYFTAHKTSTKHSVSSVSEQSRGQSLNLSQKIQHRHNSEFLNYKISNHKIPIKISEDSRDLKVPCYWYLRLNEQNTIYNTQTLLAISCSSSVHFR